MLRCRRPTQARRSISATTAFSLVLSLACWTFASTGNADELSLRPPAVPLVACDPYFSVWSQADKLTDTATTHWTGKEQVMTLLLRVDGVTYRLMGDSPASLQPLPQTSVEVLPTRTIYRFAGAGIETTLTFTTPSLPDDMSIMSRPTTYVGCDVKSTDAKSHAVELYFDAAGTLATNTPDQVVVGSMESLKNAVAVKFGTETQRVLGKAGDDLRIDWGYMYVAVPTEFQPQVAFTSTTDSQQRFTTDGAASLAAVKSSEPAEASAVGASVAIPFGEVNSDAVARYLVLAYDDLYSIQFMKKNLRPYWRKDGWEASNLIEASANEYESLLARCESFDKQLVTDLEQAGGREYASIAALAYRQCLAAGKFVADANGQPLQFCKENHSNGCIATSDVFYPMAPQFLLLGATMTKAVLVPFMDYAASDRWRFPFAPHDLGTYPHANGQRYGGGEESEENQMPVEESGNLLILFAALAKMEGNADFAEIYWPELSKWAEYLQGYGFDPANQLSTDDFAGHMAHNVNLSVKAICGLGSYAMLCEMRGLNAEAEKYRELAKRFAKQWVDAARDDDHYRLAFDQPGTWSQKYNLVWDKILGLNLFPDEVATTEMKYYQTIQNKYGLPLDNREDYTKLDWVLWTATLNQDRDDFESLVRPVYEFLNDTPDRSPMTDWYFTSSAKKRGFTARPVVGGVFLQMLYDSSTWSKYASMDQTKAANWAPMPIPPQTVSLVATGAKSDATWSYTTMRPRGDWFAPEFDVSDWKTGRGGFGTAETPGTSIGTQWNSSDIWVRRTFELSSTIPDRVALRLHHDEDSEVYINGKRVLQLAGWTTSYESFEIPADVLHEGSNTIAIHTHQTSGGQYIDAGLDAIIPGQ